MVRPRFDLRIAQKSSVKHNRSSYNNYEENVSGKKLLCALNRACNTANTSKVARDHSIPKSTLHEKLKKLKDSGNDLNEFVEKSERLTLLSTEEEAAVEKYCLYQHERGFNMTNSDVKTMIRDIHQHAVEVGNKRQPLNVKCLSMPFGVRIPQQYEDDDGVYYTEVFQTDIVPENKRIIKDGKKSREYYWVY